MDHKRTIESLT